MPYRPKGSQNWHYDFQVRGRRFCGSCGTTDWEEAKAVEAEARVAARSAPEVTGRFTLSQAIGTYYSDVCESQSSARTSKSQAAGILEMMDPERDISTLKPADIQKFVMARRKKVAAGTLNRQLDFLDRSLKHMKTIHGASIPDLGIRKLRLPEPKERVRELSADEQRRLFEKLRPDLHAFTIFALLTGARLATIANLRWQDVDRDHRRMLFHVKWSDTQRFPISPEMEVLLDGLPRSDDPEHRPYVFLYQRQDRKERPWSRFHPQAGSLWDDFRQALEEAEILNFRFHDLRHTFATRMLRQTRNLKLVSKLLGHKSIETTMRYAHVLDDDLEDALETFTAVPKAVSRTRSRSS